MCLCVRYNYNRYRTFKMTTEVWKIENNLCRCCHSEGIFMNLAVPGDYMGQKEIYTDMLRDCLAINVAPVPGALCTVTYTICDACVMRLRDACSFRQQVLDCEKQFQDMFRQNILKAADSNSHVDVKIEIPDHNSNDSRDKFDDEHNNDDHHDDHDDDDDDIEDTFEVNLDEDDELETLEAIKKRTERAAKRKMAEKTPTVKKAVKKPARKSLDEKVSAAIAKATGVQERKRASRRCYDAMYKMEEINGTEMYKCNECEKSFKDQKGFNSHYRAVHLEQRPKLKQCEKCGLQMNHSQMVLHMDKVHGIPAPSCNACGRKFRCLSLVLKHHRIAHMGEKLFNCPHCTMKFSTRCHLREHMTKHSDERPLKCEHCGKGFKTAKNLRMHVKIHLDIRNKVCHVCQKAFVQRASLKYHMTKEHPEY